MALTGDKLDLTGITQGKDLRQWPPPLSGTANPITPPPTVESAVALDIASWKGVQQHLVCITHPTPSTLRP